MSRVLVVDDALMDRRLVGGLLAKVDGLAIDYAEDGAIALEAITANPPDLIITDMLMPNLAGLELVDRVRADHPTIPIILMTSAGNEEVAAEALRRGASSYVPKRALASDLVSTTLDLLQLVSQQRDQSRLLKCMESKEISLALGNDRTLISTLVRHLQDVVGQLELCDESSCMRVGVALEEALVNALFHGNLELDSNLRETDPNSYHSAAAERCGQAPYRDRKLYVTARCDRQQARFTIRDEGPGFDPATLPDPTDPANLEKVSGRGVFLMRTFMDEVEFNGRGNEVTMTKRKINGAVAEQ